MAESPGLTISNLEYGYSFEGLETYLAEIQSIVLKDAVEALENIETIQTACDANWAGKAKINFINNLKSDIAHVVSQYQELYQVLNKEITQVQYSMEEFDKNLIKSEK